MVGWKKCVSLHHVVVVVVVVAVAVAVDVDFDFTFVVVVVLVIIVVVCIPLLKPKVDFLFEGPSQGTTLGTERLQVDLTQDPPAPRCEVTSLDLPLVTGRCLFIIPSFDLF